MIKKIIGIIVYFVILICTSQTVILSSFLLNKNKQASLLIKKLFFDLGAFFYTKCFNSRIFYSGEYKQSDKVDIIISNHLNTLDYINYSSIFNEYDNRNLLIILKKEELFTIGAGVILSGGGDIYLNRKLEDDKHNISNSVKNINNSVIVIMPEGTRYTDEKKKIAQQYSKDNNLPIFKNTLFPKMKGLWIIVNELKKQNRLGNIIDFTLKIDNNVGHQLNSLLKNNMGDSYNIINTYEIPNDKIEDYDIFKKWFLNNIWKKKDKILTNFNKNNYEFKQINPSIKPHVYMLVIIVICWYLYLVKKTKFLYLVFGFIVSYIIVFYRYKKISNT
jgi:1-acyl-sn-glycerol-3-phosphate acyltransferase